MSAFRSNNLLPASLPSPYLSPACALPSSSCHSNSSQASASPAFKATQQGSQRKRSVCKEDDSITTVDCNINEAQKQHQQKHQQPLQKLSYPHNVRSVAELPPPPAPSSFCTGFLIYNEDQLEDPTNRERLASAIHSHYSGEQGGRKFFYVHSSDYHQIAAARVYRDSDAELQQQKKENFNFCSLQQSIGAGNHRCTRVAVLIRKTTVVRFPAYHSSTDFGSFHINIPEPVQEFIQLLSQKFLLIKSATPHQLKVRCEIDTYGLPKWKVSDSFWPDSSAAENRVDESQKGVQIELLICKPESNENEEIRSGQSQARGAAKGQTVIQQTQQHQNESNRDSSFIDKTQELSCSKDSLPPNSSSSSGSRGLEEGTEDSNDGSFTCAIKKIKTTRNPVGSGGAETNAAAADRSSDAFFTAAGQTSEEFSPTPSPASVVFEANRADNKISEAQFSSSLKLDGLPATELLEYMRSACTKNTEIDVLLYFNYASPFRKTYSLIVSLIHLRIAGQDPLRPQRCFPSAASLTPAIQRPLCSADESAVLYSTRFNSFPSDQHRGLLKPPGFATAAGALNQRAGNYSRGSSLQSSSLYAASTAAAEPYGLPKNRSDHTQQRQKAEQPEIDVGEISSLDNLSTTASARLQSPDPLKGLRSHSSAAAAAVPQFPPSEFPSLLADGRRRFPGGSADATLQPADSSPFDLNSLHLRPAGLNAPLSNSHDQSKPLSGFCDRRRSQPLVDAYSSRRQTAVEKREAPSDRLPFSDSEILVANSRRDCHNHPSTADSEAAVYDVYGGRTRMRRLRRGSLSLASTDHSDASLPGCSRESDEQQQHSHRTHHTRHPHLHPERHSDAPQRDAAAARAPHGRRLRTRGTLWRALTKHSGGGAERSLSSSLDGREAVERSAASGRHASNSENEEYNSNYYYEDNCTSSSGASYTSVSSASTEPIQSSALMLEGAGGADGEEDGENSSSSGGHTKAYDYPDIHPRNVKMRMLRERVMLQEQQQKQRQQNAVITLSNGKHLLPPSTSLGNQQGSRSSSRSGETELSSRMQQQTLRSLSAAAAYSAESGVELADDQTSHSRRLSTTTTEESFQLLLPPLDDQQPSFCNTTSGASVSVASTAAAAGGGGGGTAASGAPIYSVGDLVEIIECGDRKDLHEGQLGEILHIRRNGEESTVTTTEGTTLFGHSKEAEEDEVAVEGEDLTRAQSGFYVCIHLCRADGKRSRTERANAIKEAVDRSTHRILQQQFLPIDPPPFADSLSLPSPAAPAASAAAASPALLPLPDSAVAAAANIRDKFQKNVSVATNALNQLVSAPFSLSCPRTAEGILCFFWDLEATGLDVSQDEITQIACVCRRFHFGRSSSSSSKSSANMELTKAAAETPANDNSGRSEAGEFPSGNCTAAASSEEKSLCAKDGSAAGVGSWDVVEGYPDKEFNRYVHTNRVVPKAVIELTGITNEFLDKYGN